MIRAISATGRPCSGLRRSAPSRCDAPSAPRHLILLLISARAHVKMVCCRQLGMRLLTVALLAAAAASAPLLGSDPSEPLSFMHTTGAAPAAKPRTEDIPYIRCQVRMAVVQWQGRTSGSCALQSEGARRKPAGPRDAAGLRAAGHSCLEAGQAAAEAGYARQPGKAAEPGCTVSAQLREFFAASKRMPDVAWGEPAQHSFSFCFAAVLCHPELSRLVMSVCVQVHEDRLIDLVEQLTNGGNCFCFGAGSA